MKTNRRTRAESQWIVGQAYSHTYNTQFHIKVVYRGFIALRAVQAIRDGVRPKPIATRKHYEQWYRRFPA